ncbi:MAG: hypothetical protein JW781_07930 [Deltaproteobacteria bacterium]|nr:hypothetical protein [Candidatus Anaeroferrophillacea bacterium]
MKVAMVRKLMVNIILFLSLLLAGAAPVFAAYGDHAGLYGENDGIHGGNRLDPGAYPSMDSRIKGWATEVVNSWRPDAATFGSPTDVLGQPGGTFDVFSLGDGGSITVTFPVPIGRGDGPDFAVWENGFVSVQGGETGMLFAELCYVEVSSDGVHFVRFPSVNGSPDSLGGFDCIDPTYYHNLAGKHPNGNDGRDEGTPFELNVLANDPEVLNGNVDLDNILYVRLIDLVGDGSTFDSLGNPIYDPYPTPFGTGGCDVDAVGVLNQGGINQPPDQPTPVAPEDGAAEVTLPVVLSSSAFSDPDIDSEHGSTQWQVSVSAGFETTVFDSTSATELIDITLDDSDLNDGITYYWRARHYDDDGAASAWSATSSFTTAAAVIPNSAPNQPSLSAPANGATDISMPVTLSTSVFSDPDVDSEHGSTQWQVSESSGFGTTAYDATSSEHLTALTLDNTFLLADTTYYWRARHYDDDGVASAWSATSSFTTIVGGNSQAWPENPLVPVVWPAQVDPLTTPVQVGACPDVTVRPSLQVSAADVGKTATLIMYIYFPDYGFGISMRSASKKLTTETVFDLIPTELDLSDVGRYSFHIYYGYMVGSDIIYSAYALTVGDACGN